MRDEEYRPEQIPTYGSHEQFALAERMRPLLRMTQVGNGFALLAVLAAISALFTYPTNLYSDNAGRGWAIAALICSVLLLGICTFQHLCWLRAMAVWRDQSQTDVRQLRTFSYAAQLASYLVVAVALWVAIAGIVYAGWLATASILLMLTLVSCWWPRCWPASNMCGSAAHPAPCPPTCDEWSCGRTCATPREVTFAQVVRVTDT